MADYSDAYRTMCGYCGEWYGHAEDCSSPHMQRVRELQEAKANGFSPVNATTHPETDFYECMYGCGTLVWDMKAHRANVCREPVVK